MAKRHRVNRDIVSKFPDIAVTISEVRPVGNWFCELGRAFLDPRTLVAIAIIILTKGCKL